MQVDQLHVNNFQLHTNFPFDEYQSLPGWSYSGIKEWERGTKIEPTEKMRIGTLVHSYLLEPSSYTHEYREIVIHAANAVKQTLGALLPIMTHEASITADFNYQGLTMPYRGRADMIRVGKIVLDLKVSEMPLAKSIPFFGYQNAMSGYALAAGCKVAIIVRVCPKKFTTEVKTVPITPEWWMAQVLRFGKPL